jgi:hypothetical protein
MEGYWLMKTINTFVSILFVSLLSSPSWSDAIDIDVLTYELNALIWHHEYSAYLNNFGPQKSVIGAIAVSAMVFWLSKTIKALFRDIRSASEQERVIIERDRRIKNTGAKNVSNSATKATDAEVVFNGRVQRVSSRGYLFSEEKKVSLIRELLGQRIEQRMRMDGFDGMEYRLEVEKLGDIELIGTPEGTILAIVEDAIKMHKQGAQLSDILGLIEGSRKHEGHIESEFIKILRVANKPLLPNPCIKMYCNYRMAIEHNSVITPSEVDYAIEKISNEIMKW